MSGAHAPLLDGFPHGHAGMGEVHNGLLVGVSTFQPARTHWAFFAYVVMLSCFAVYIFADPVHFPSRLNGPDKIDFAFKVNASVHTLFVLLAFALAKVMRAGHKAQKRLGHIRLHSKLKPYVHAPVVATVAGECVLVALGVWIQNRDLDSDLNDVLKAIVGIEDVVLALCLADYARILSSHNRKRPPPDALTVLQEMAGPEEGMGGAAPLLYAMDHGLGLDSVTDEQAELIRFLQLRTTQLSKQVLRLQAKLDHNASYGYDLGSPVKSPVKRGVGGEAGVEGGAGGAGAVSREDVDHILAARDREIRALNAERDALQRELRDGKKRLMETDSNHQQLMSTNQQHVAENARLRAIIHEWSVRHAKLEQRLQNKRP